MRRSSGVEDSVMGAGLLAGAANVIMQLSRPGVGYGVVSLLGSVSVGAVTLSARGAEAFPSGEVVRVIEPVVPHGGRGGGIARVAGEEADRLRALGQARRNQFPRQASE